MPSTYPLTSARCSRDAIPSFFDSYTSSIGENIAARRKLDIRRSFQPSPPASSGDRSRDRDPPRSSISTAPLPPQNFLHSLAISSPTRSPTPPSSFARYSQDMRRKALLRLSASQLSPAAFDTALTSDESSAQTASSPHQSDFSPVTPPAIASHDDSTGMDLSFHVSQEIDYFSYKKPTYFPSHLIYSAHSGSTTASVGSYFSPAVTPAGGRSLTRPSSPTIPSFVPTFPPTPEEDHFPYKAYESAYDAAKSVSPPMIDIKVYFDLKDELVKFRVARDISRGDFIRMVAKRVPAGWESLYGALVGADVTDIPSTPHDRLKRLGKDNDWQSWLSSAVKTKRIVLWAI